jgi:hypothetical protein
MTASRATRAMNLTEALGRAGNCRRVGGSFRIRCPAHGGRDFNCAVWEDERGQVRFRCWSRGCNPRAIRRALLGHEVETHFVDLAATGPVPNETTKRECAQRIWRQSTRPAGARAMNRPKAAWLEAARVPRQIRRRQRPKAKRTREEALSEFCDRIADFYNRVRP